MTDFQPKQSYGQVIKACAQELRNAGYVRRGNSLQKRCNEATAIVDFQKSSRNDSKAVHFTINLGIVCSQLLEGEKSSSKGIGIVDAHVRQRVGMFLVGRPDKWWTIDQKTDAGPLIDEISGLLKREATPYLDRYLNGNALVALWKSGQSPRLTETQRMRYLKKLTQMREWAA